METSQPVSFISLKPLYEFIRTHRRDYLQALNLMERLGEDYGAKCKELAEIIPKSQGIYVWGAFDSPKYWQSIYLGKAGLGKSTKLLQARITEELKDERCSLWREKLSEAELYRAGPQVHKGGAKTWDRYIRNAWKRALRKAGATHIIWAETPSLDNSEVRRVEAELIEALNPSGNVQRPIPPRHLVREATQIFLQLRQTVHEIRDLGHKDVRGPFVLSLKSK